MSTPPVKNSFSNRSTGNAASSALVYRANVLLALALLISALMIASLQTTMVNNYSLQYATINRIDTPKTDDKLIKTEATTTTTSMKTEAMTTTTRCPDPFLAKARYTYSRDSHQEQVFTSLSDSTLVIIGANIGATDTDGSWNLLKQHKGIQKVFVEPIPTLFQKLQKNVGEANLSRTMLRNLAIGQEKGTTTMYCWDLAKLKPLNLPYWFEQICSFERDRLFRNGYDTGKFMRRHFQNNRTAIKEFANENIVPVTVEQDTVRGVLETAVGESNLHQVSVVQIDTEGFDYHVVQQLPFEDVPSFRPCLVVWEDILLSRKQNLELLNRISQFGYGMSYEKQNIFMYRYE